MTNPRSLRPIAFSLLLLLAPLTAAATGQVGEPGADFTLTSTTGDTYSLSLHQGEVVFLWLIGYS